MAAYRLFMAGGLAAVLWGATAAPAGAEAAGVSGRLAVVSDYVFRGLSLSKGDPAVQGSLEYGGTSGPFAGLWASTARFAPGDDVEVALYAGYDGGGEAGFFQISGWYYAYPGGATGDRWEILARTGIDYGFVRVALLAGASPDYFDSGAAFRGALEIDAPVPVRGEVTVALGGHFGVQTIKRAARFGSGDYLDWSLGITVGWRSLDFDLRYSDSDIDRASPLRAGARLVAGLTYFF